MHRAARSAIAGQAGEVIRIPVTDLYPKFDQIFQGISVQAVGNNVQIDTTLAPIDLAMDPAQDSSPIWFADTTAVAGHIETLKNMCTAIRITFAADAIVYVAGV